MRICLLTGEFSLFIFIVVTAMFGFFYILKFCAIDHAFFFFCFFFSSFLIGIKLIGFSLFFSLVDWKFHIQFLECITSHYL